MADKRIVILGGYGTFGSLISDQLAGEGVKVVVAGRDVEKGKSFAKKIQASFVHCDASDDISLRKAIRGAFLVVNASGPFQKENFSIPLTCISEKCHYIDIADGREYVTNFHKLGDQAKQNSVFACTGASTSPAVTSALVDKLIKDVPDFTSIQIAMNPGNKNPAGISTIQSILSYVGAPFLVLENGMWQETHGWTRGEFINFPEPIGKRRVHMCNVPDLEFFPQKYEAETVTFKAGVELNLFNYAIEMLGRLRQRIPSLDLSKLANLLIKGSAFFKAFGTTTGGLQVWIFNQKGQKASMAIIAPKDGPRIPIAPAVVIAKKLLQNKFTEYGAFPCMGFIQVDELQDFLSPFGITFQKLGQSTATTPAQRGESMQP